MLVGDHRGHDPQVRVGCGVGGGERLELAFEHVHVGAQGTQATQAEGRVRLVFRSQERSGLSAPASSMRITTFLPGNWLSSSV